MADKKSGRHTGGTARTPERESIESWLKQVRFKRALIGGVDEADVWKKIAELNALYGQELKAERARYDALLDERLRGAVRQAARIIEERDRRRRMQSTAESERACNGEEA